MHVCKNICVLSGSGIEGLVENESEENYINERFNAKCFYLESSVLLLCNIRKTNYNQKNHLWYLSILWKCDITDSIALSPSLLNKYVISVLCLSHTAESWLSSLSKGSVRSLQNIQAHEHVVYVTYLVFLMHSTCPWPILWNSFLYLFYLSLFPTVLNVAILFRVICHWEYLI